MNAILDVHYREGTAWVACVQFRDASDERPSAANLHRLDIPADYVPGRFFERELPCLLHALEQEVAEFDILVVDGYVHLKPPRRKGLGAHLADSLPYRASVIGVAKNPLALAERFVPVLRGRSRKPLFVSAARMPLERAAGLVRNMRGDFRIPTLIRMADRLSRTGREG